MCGWGPMHMYMFVWETCINLHAHGTCQWECAQIPSNPLLPALHLPIDHSAPSRSRTLVGSAHGTREVEKCGGWECRLPG